MTNSMVFKILEKLTELLPPPQGMGHHITIGNRHREVLQFHVVYESSGKVSSSCVSLASYMVEDVKDFTQWWEVLCRGLPEWLRLALSCE